MSVKIKHIIDEMEKIAPVGLACPWDNVGLIIGDENGLAENVLVALDVTGDVVSEAIANNAQLIISHHPLVFKPVSNITASTPLGRGILRLIKNNISVYSAHTNLDASDNGTNAVLCKILGLVEVQPIIYDGAGAMGRCGYLQGGLTVESLAEKLKKALSCNFIRVCGEGGTKAAKIAICAGSGSKPGCFEEAVANGCNVFITGDTRFHELQYALELGLCVIDATHYATELPVIHELCNMLKNIFGGNVVFMESGTNGQVYKI